MFLRLLLDEVVQYNYDDDDDDDDDDNNNHRDINFFISVLTRLALRTFERQQVLINETVR
jgi:uncharacterized protein YgfB (UPF0149 family)